MTGHHRDEGADRPAAEDDTASPSFTSARRTSCVATASGSITAASSSPSVAGTREQARRRHRPVLLHPAGHVHAEHAQPVAEIGGAHPAGAAGAAHLERLHHHALARAEAAGGGRLHDVGQGLVADGRRPPGCGGRGGPGRCAGPSRRCRRSARAAAPRRRPAPASAPRRCGTAGCARRRRRASAASRRRLPDTSILASPRAASIQRSQAWLCFWPSQLALELLLSAGSSGPVRRALHHLHHVVAHRRLHGRARLAGRRLQRGQPARRRAASRRAWPSRSAASRRQSRRPSWPRPPDCRPWPRRRAAWPARARRCRPCAA